MATNARFRIVAVRQIEQPRHICLEEGTLWEWLYEVVSPHAGKAVVVAGRGRATAEVDGFTHHGTRHGFEHDRARDADLAARGVLVIRVTWRQLRHTPDAVVGTIARALGQAEARAGIAEPQAPPAPPAPR